MPDQNHSEFEKLSVASFDIPAQKRNELVHLFPEVRTEGGKIDFDRLKAVLGEVIDTGRERYGMNWPGKAECMRTIQSPSLGTLLPMREQSVDWDNTENVIIEGDNLEVLKLLQKSYLGKVKMIYIDPPYNTGNDFIYPDNFSESLQTYLEFSGQVDGDGRKFGTNTDTDGRFHSKWLNMMYPRLYLARNLLREDGIIFVSIDDSEMATLKQMMDSLFGEDAFVATLVWQNKTGAGAKSKGFIGLHEYVLCYAKSMGPAWDVSIEMSEKTKQMYNKRDQHFERLGPYATWPLDTTSMDERANLRFPILHEGTEIWPKKQWLWSRERVEKAQREGKLVFNKNRKDGTWNVRFKGYLRDEDGEQKLGKPTSVYVGPYTQQGTNDFRRYFERELFDFPKPIELIKQLLSVRVVPEIDGECIVLDFFAGSGTLGEAVMELNSEDGIRRKFILVQLPEPIEHEKLQTVSAVVRERTRLAGSRIARESAESLDLDNRGAGDYGFRSFELGSSNFIPWDGTASNDAEQLVKQLELGIEHTRSDRTPDDLLYEILLKSWGEPALSLKVLEEVIEGIRVFTIADGDLLICLEEKVSIDFIRALAARMPDRVVMRESAFSGNDQLKANASQAFKSKGVTSFKVV